MYIDLNILQFLLSIKLTLIENHDRIISSDFLAQILGRMFQKRLISGQESACKSIYSQLRANKAASHDCKRYSENQLGALKTGSQIQIQRQRQEQGFG